MYKKNILFLHAIYDNDNDIVKISANSIMNQMGVRVIYKAIFIDIKNNKFIEEINRAISDHVDKVDYFIIVPQENVLAPDTIISQIYAMNKTFLACTCDIRKIRWRLGKLINIDNNKVENFILSNKHIEHIIPPEMESPVVAGILFSIDIYKEIGAFNDEYYIVFFIDYLIRVLKKYNMLFYGSTLMSFHIFDTTYSDMYGEVEYKKQFNTEIEKLKEKYEI